MPDPIQLLQNARTPQQVEMNPRHFDIEIEEGQDSFSDMLTNAINGVDESMKNSERQVENFVAGKTDNVHDVMVSMQQAQLSFQLMVEVRNKAIETYNEISRMQI